jgi:hypothetical protein
MCLCLPDRESKGVTDQTSQEPPHKSYLLPGLGVAILYPRIAALRFSPRDIRALFKHTEFATLEWRSHQICFLQAYTGKTFNRCINMKELSDIFGMSERTIWRILAKGPQDPSPPGCHRAMDDETESTFVHIIVEAFHRAQALTNKKMLQIISQQRDGCTHSSVAILTNFKYAARFLKKILE